MSLCVRVSGLSVVCVRLYFPSCAVLNDHVISAGHVIRGSASFASKQIEFSKHRTRGLDWSGATLGSSHGNIRLAWPAGNIMLYEYESLQLEDDAEDDIFDAC